MASGAGALGNKSIGIAAAGGMLTGTMFGLIIVPGLYVVFASLSERRARKLNIKFMKTLSAIATHGD
jgi:HAE1 family hydrophobic/amphiphilic exporter-1